MTSNEEAMGREVPSSVTPTGRSFASFYEREVVGQTRRAMLILCSREAAEDAVHDAFVSVYQRWDELDLPGAYLERAVLNRCRDIERRRVVAQRHVKSVSAEVPAQDAPLFDALGRLKFNHRAAIVLRYYHQLTEAEIASALGCRPGSVGPWIHRGLRQLSKELS